MSEPIPESIPTSADRRSQRPTKKRALTPVSQQSAQVDALFANPDREITIPAAPQNKTLAPPPEIVANVQGSSAGAGSGEFHVYKASRRREYERLRLMDEEVEREQKNQEFEQRREEIQSRDQEKLSKNQAKRAKMKARKEKAEVMRKAGTLQRMEETGEAAVANDQIDGPIKRKLGPAKVLLSRGDDQVANAEAKNGNEHQDNHVALESGITFHDED